MRHHRSRRKSTYSSLKYLIKNIKKRYAQGKEHAGWSKLSDEQMKAVMRCLDYLDIPVSITVIKDESTDKEIHQFTFKE